MKCSIGRALVTAAFLAMGSVWSGTASASTVTYDLTLSHVHGIHPQLDGTGILTLNDPVNPTGWENIKPQDDDVSVFTISIGGHTFDLSNSFGLIVFHNGNLRRIFAAGLDDDQDALLTIAFLGTALLFEKHDHPEVAFDHISAVDPPGSTPLPSTWSLMLVGFGALGFACFRARRTPALAAV